MNRWNGEKFHFKGKTFLFKFTHCIIETLFLISVTVYFISFSFPIAFRPAHLLFIIIRNLIRFSNENLFVNREKRIQIGWYFSKNYVCWGFRAIQTTVSIPSTTFHICKYHYAIWNSNLRASSFHICQQKLTKCCHIWYAKHKIQRKEERKNKIFEF